MASSPSNPRIPSPSPSLSLSRSTPSPAPSYSSSIRPSITRHTSFSSISSFATDEDLEVKSSLRLPSIESLNIQSHHRLPSPHTHFHINSHLQAPKPHDPILRRLTVPKPTTPRLVVVSPAMAHHIALGGSVNIRGPNGQVVGRIRSSYNPYRRKIITV